MEVLIFYTHNMPLLGAQSAKAKNQNVREIPPKQPRMTGVRDGRSYH